MDPAPAREGEYMKIKGTHIGILPALLAALFLLVGCQRQKPAPLLVYCAAGIKPPVEEVARTYEREFGIPVQLQYGGSGTLLGNIRVTKSGDLFVAGDDSFIRIGREQGLVAESIPLAQMHPVIITRPGNPLGITTLADLLRVSVALANPDAASIGKTTQRILEKEGSWATLKAHAKVFKPTVNDIANDVKLGAVDSGIVWDATARQYPELAVVRVPVFDAAVETVTVGVLTCSRQPTEALRFARYLGARDKGSPLFAQKGYAAGEGDGWAVTPEITLFSGAMLRPGIETTLKEFERREGCRITTVYNGCGILTAQMRTGQRPDAYFSCDTTFMNTVADMYLTPVNVVDNHLMILVAKGNPMGIRTIADLLRPEVRVGLPHHEKSAMGNVAWKMLLDLGVYTQLAANLKVESPTGDFLVNQLRTGSLDAIIACRSNWAGVKDYLDAIPIEHRLAQMTQPYAVGKETRYRQMMTRLQAALVSAESRKRFELAGFRWLGNKP